MKLNEGFLLRRVARSWVVVAVGAACLDLDGMLTLNESGALLWNALEQGADMDQLVTHLTSEYDVTAAQAQLDAEEFVEKLRQAGCLDVQ